MGELVHDDLAARMSAPSTVLRIVDTRTSAALARGASLVVTSRYHPAVFAVSGGVPTIGIAVDDYTTVKLTGALGNVGQTSVLSADALDPDADVVFVHTGGSPGLFAYTPAFSAR